MPKENSFKEDICCQIAISALMYYLEVPTKDIISTQALLWAYKLAKYMFNQTRSDTQINSQSIVNIQGITFYTNNDSEQRELTIDIVMPPPIVCNYSSASNTRARM